MSKGSRSRPFSVSQEKFGNNYDAIFRKPDPRVVEDQKNEDEAFEQIAKYSQVKAPDTPLGWTRHADGKVSPPPGTIFTAQGG
jgi:hypothetical protein